MTCEHPDFVAVVDVNRLSDVEGGPISAFSADVRVRCAECDEPFVFIGVPLGLSPMHPTGSLDGSALSCPIRPASAPEGWGEDGVGFSVRVSGQAHCRNHPFNIKACIRCQAAERRHARRIAN